MYTRVYIYTLLYAYVYSCIRMYTPVYICILLYKYAYTYVYSCIHMHTYVYYNIHMYTPVYICILLYAYTFRKATVPLYGLLIKETSMLSKLYLPLVLMKMPCQTCTSSSEFILCKSCFLLCISIVVAFPCMYKYILSIYIYKYARPDICEQIS